MFVNLLCDFYQRVYIYIQPKQTMLKFILLSFIVIFFTNICCGQKHFQLTIKLDSSINPKNIWYQYSTGKTTFTSPTTINQNTEIVLKDSYFTKYASFKIMYTDKEGTTYLSDFFLWDKPAEINFYCKPNTEQLLLYKHIKNALPVYDTATNKTYRELTHFNKDENLALYNFSQKHQKQLYSNDSIKMVYAQMLKSIQIRSMQFLKKYPDDYFSFWYFKNEIAIESLTDTKIDTVYLKEQLAYLKTTFSKKYTQNIEGRVLIKMYERKLYPLKTHEAAPLFNIKTIDGRNFTLSGLKGKYVLLDFWATWCVPCMDEIPFIKTIQKNYQTNKLTIIGISQDRDLNKLREVVKQKSMNWLHILDRERDISRLYGINAFPTLILINKKGNIIYKSNYVMNDEEELPKILNKLN